MTRKSPSKTKSRKLESSLNTCGRIIESTPIGTRRNLPRKPKPAISHAQAATLEAAVKPRKTRDELIDEQVKVQKIGPTCWLVIMSGRNLSAAIDETTAESLAARFRRSLRAAFAAVDKAEREQE